MSTFIVTSAAYISACGPDNNIRFSTNREINIIDFLPSHLRQDEAADVVQIFQDFLNTIYDEKKYLTSANSYELSKRPKISILEKINRLTELHDPDLIDIEYIQYFANYLGYAVDINRGDIGIANTTSNDECQQEDVKRYLRFVVSNLPNWYKIKTTRSSVKIMLYSFGLIGDILQLFTKDYLPDMGDNWLAYREDTPGYLNDMPTTFYPTSHFTIFIDLDSSITDISLSNIARQEVFRAVNSVRPANTVFEGMTGYVHPPKIVMNYAAYSRTNLFMTIKVS